MTEFRRSITLRRRPLSA